MIHHDLCVKEYHVHRMNPITKMLEHWADIYERWEVCGAPNRIQANPEAFTNTTYNNTWCEPFEGMEE